MKTVSLIIPCHNCENFADTMMMSILSQEWNDIEVILINDGSTDASERVLLDWKAKFENKGYTSKYFYQTNKGVTGAINTGLANITGDYICFLDHDDSLKPCFVSDMADFLDKNPQCNWVRCDADVVMEENPFVPVYTISDKTDERAYPGFLTKYLCGRVPPVIWTSMVRSEYLRSCLPSMRLPEGLPVQENSIQIPLAFKSDPAYINKPNYRYYVRQNSTWHGWQSQPAILIKKYMEIMQSAIDEVSKLPISSGTRELYETLIFLNYVTIVKSFYPRHEKTGNELRIWMDKFISLLNDKLQVRTKVTYYEAYNFTECLTQMAIDILLNLTPADDLLSKNNFIIYGYGQKGKYYLEHLKYTDVLPREIWDISAVNGDLFHTVPISKPQPIAGLTGIKADILIPVVIEDKRVNDAVREDLAAYGFNNILNYRKSSDILNFTCVDYFRNR